MKLLIESYKVIVANWMQQSNANEIDLANALHKFTTAVVNKNDLLPAGSMEERTFCERCDSSKNIMFEKINGSFCSDCGYILPF